MHRLPRRLLLVDDSADDRAELIRLLAKDPKHRYETVCAASVQGGLEAAAQSSFDVVLVDWFLPDGIGLELVDVLRARGDLLPVIVVSGSPLEERYEQALGRGVHDLIAKDDLELKRLCRTIEQAIVRARLERGLLQAREAERSAIAGERKARQDAELAARRAAHTKESLASLHVLNEAFASAIRVDDVCAVLLAHASVFTGASAGNVFLLEGDELVFRGGFGLLEGELLGWEKVGINDRTPLSEAARRGEQVAIATTEDHRKQYPGLAVRDAQAWIATPLHTEEAVMGVIGLRYPEGALPAADDRLFITMVAEGLTQAVVRARLYDEARSRAAFERRLLAVIGHDLRTPLSAVTLAAQALRLQLPEHPVLDRLDRSAARMRAIIEDVLSRSELSVELSQTVAVPLDALVQDQVEELRTAFPGRSISFVDEGAPALLVEAAMVSQIVANLVRNALQHGQADTPVHVTLLSSGGVAALRVENRGPTISSADLAELFSPFRRGARASGRGSGLGLFIVQENATALGATVDVSSVGSVTAFTVRFNGNERVSRIPGAPSPNSN